LVKQEMDRTIESLRKRDDWWQSWTENRGVEDPRLQEGLRAYAKKQGFIQQSLA
ncbi:hypothetical protein BT96DRAFT_759332, partial [Gymnopus androsaceus JB14]